MVQLNLALKEKQKKPKPYFIKIQFFDWHMSFCELERVSGKIFHKYEHTPFICSKTFGLCFTKDLWTYDQIY